MTFSTKTCIQRLQLHASNVSFCQSAPHRCSRRVERPHLRTFCWRGPLQRGPTEGSPLSTSRSDAEHSLCDHPRGSSIRGPVMPPESPGITALWRRPFTGLRIAALGLGWMGVDSFAAQVDVSRSCSLRRRAARASGGSLASSDKGGVPCPVSDDPSSPNQQPRITVASPWPFLVPRPNLH